MDQRRTFKKRLRRCAVVFFLLSLAVFGIDYFFFHYVTAGGIVSAALSEPDKPFVTLLIGVLGTDLLFASFASAVLAHILPDKKSE